MHWIMTMQMVFTENLYPVKASGSVLAVTELEQLLQVGPEDVHDHHVEVAFCPVVVHLREPGLPMEQLVELRLVLQLRKPALQRLLSIIVYHQTVSVCPSNR